MLIQHKIGTPYLLLEGVDCPCGKEGFPCGSFETTLTVNQIPTATVLVCFGSPTNEHRSTHQAYSLLSQIFAATNDGAYVRRIPCKVYELAEDNGERISLFNGVVSAGTLQKDASGAVIAVQITITAGVMTRLRNPISSTPQLKGPDHLIQWLLDPVGGFGASSSTDMAQGIEPDMLDEMVTTTSTMADIIVCATSLLIAQRIYADRGDTDVKAVTQEYIELLTPAFRSDWRLSDVVLKSGNLSASTDQVVAAEFAKGFMKALSTILQGKPDSIFTALVRVLTSPEYMLNLAPRLEPSGDVVFDCMPCVSWLSLDNLGTINLTQAHLTEVSGYYNPDEVESTPEVMLVPFNTTTTDMAAGNWTTGSEFGVYSTMDEVRKLWDTFTAQDTSMEEQKKLIPAVSEYRVTTREPPKWAETVVKLMQNVANNEELAKFDAKDHAPKSVPNESPAVKKTVSAKPLLDALAKAIFLNEFGSADNMVVCLPIGCSMGRELSVGRLESHLGKLIVIWPDSEPYLGFGFVGILETLHISSSFGGGAVSGKLKLNLRQVHTWDDGKNNKEEFPLYTNRR